MTNTQGSELREELTDVLMAPNQAWQGMKEIPIELIWGLEKLVASHVAEELSRLAVDDDGQTFVCYFDDEGDCKRDVSLTDRIAQLTKQDKRQQ